MNSDFSVNYSIRPAKCVERKMICHSLQRLCTFSTLDKYQYIGLGAVYFHDFILFHKELNIKYMHSIQNIDRYVFDDNGIRELIPSEIPERTKIERYTNNKPYKCINMYFGFTSMILSQLNYKKKSILWLDYDDAINPLVIDDIKLVTSSINSGSVFLISCNATLPKPHSPSKQFKKFERKIGSDLVSDAGITEETFAKSNGLILATKKIFDLLVDNFLGLRNRSVPKDEQVKFHQLYYFSYKDGSLMLTVGGIFVANKEKSLYDRCNFKQFDFLKLDKNDFKPFDICIPNLTIREIKMLSQYMPTSRRKINQKALSGVDHLDFLNFSKIYRYFPSYSELFI